MARPILIGVNVESKQPTKQTEAERSQKSDWAQVGLHHKLTFSNSVCATHPVTFNSGTVPGCQKSATPRQNTSSSARFDAWEKQAVHLNFLPVSSLLLDAMTLETGVSRCFHPACI